MLSSIKSVIAPGIYCRNDSEIPILFVMSQLSPLHWSKVEPGEIKHLNCGRVLFTVSIEPWIEGKEPTQLEVAAKIGAVVTATVFGGGIIGVGLVGGLTGISSVRGISLNGIVADGRVAVIKGRKIETTGVYELYFHSLEYPKSETNTESNVETTTPEAAAELIEVKYPLSAIEL